MEEVKALLTCPICYEAYDQDRVACALICLHTFCEPCLTKLGNLIACPICKHQTVVKGKVPKNYALQAIVDVLASISVSKHSPTYDMAWDLTFGMGKSSINHPKAIELLENELKQMKKKETRDLMDKMECLLAYLYFERSAESWSSADGIKAQKLWLESKDFRSQFYLSVYYSSQSQTTLAASSLDNFTSSFTTLTKPEAWSTYLYGSLQTAKVGFKLILEAAKMNFAPAQWNTGMCYWQGIGVTSNKKEAFNYYEQAALQGDAASQYFLGLCFNQGDEVKKDTQKALHYFSLAADQNMALAQRSMGELSEDEKKSEDWFRKAALNGDMESQYRLGRLLVKLGNQKEAQEWYQKAAKSGHVEACKYLEDGI